MSRDELVLDERLRRYLDVHAGRPDPILERLRAATDRLPGASARTPALEAHLLAFLVELIGARQVLEIGCFTGHGTLALARALPAGGRVTTLEADPRLPEIGRPFWAEAGVAERIELRLGDARESLAALLAEGRAGGFDMAFIDADKKAYGDYFDMALQLVRKGGLIVVDNTLWAGRVADPADRSRQTEAIRALNRRILADPAVAMVLLPIADGVTLVRRR